MLPNTHSTLRALRINLGLTQSELAFQAHITRHSVLRMEQLCYPTPLPSIIATLSDISGQSNSGLSAQYYQDVFENRSTTRAIIFQDIKWADSLAKLSFAPWRQAIFEVCNEPVSLIHFCIRTSIHPATLAKYEESPTSLMPNSIKEVLVNDLGVPLETISLFNKGVINVPQSA